MKVSLSLKLTALLCVFGLLLTGLATYYSLSSSKQIVVASAKRDLLVANQVIGRNLQLQLQSFSNDAQLLAEQSQARDILLNSSERAEEIQELAQLFRGMLKAQPEYQRLRLIDAGHFGMELLSVDRNGRVPDSDLKERGHFPYVFKALKLKPGNQYLSDISSHNAASDESLKLQLASPIWSEDQKAIGVIVLSIDIEELFQRMQEELPDYYQIFLANSDGLMMLNPEHSTATRKVRGPSVQLQEQIPQTQDLISAETDRLLVALPARHKQPPRLASFTRLEIGNGDTKTPLILGLAIPEEHILRASHQLDERMIQLVTGLCLLTFLLSLWLARTLIRPLNQMGQAISQFTQNFSLTPLPTRRNDELGQLARDLRKMQERILAQISELNANHVAMQHMAHDDPLTGLPNRRLFFNRLEHAIANAERSGKQVGLLYVDLDYFKEINDTYGHAVGDEVLRTVAGLLSSVTRSGDTVARLGGDEFIILFDEIEDSKTLVSIAQKLLSHMQNRMLIKGHDLQVKASLGISLYPRDGQNAEALVQNADKAMYCSKRDGRNQITMAQGHLLR
jgi:diguanylate cyclase (GGDEF)-like protein